MYKILSKKEGMKLVKKKVYKILSKKIMQEISAMNFSSIVYKILSKKGKMIKKKTRR